MRRVLLIPILLLFAAAVPGAQSVSVSQQQRQLDIESELERLPTYGVFDFIRFDYDQGKVTLDGYSYQGGLKSHAENAVKRVPGVDTVDNKIELLPASTNDDRIRWATFYNIYNDSFLSRYAPGGEMGARYELRQARRFPGMQPFGDYPVHIIVKNGRTTLMGIVGTEMDKRIAEIRAREVTGVFAVENQLVIDSD
jgi:hyperosmotically inducible periplasmic protein